MKKTIRAATVLLFMLMLIAPAVQQRFELFKIKPLNENRYQTKPPELTIPAILSADAKTAKDYEQFYNDTYGLRDLLIRTKHQIDFTAFHQSDKLFIGNDHWLFYKSVVEDEQIELEKITPAQKAAFVRNVVATRDYFQKRGIYFLTVALPMKSTLYPEQLPAWSPKRPANVTFHQLRHRLAESGIPFIDGYEILNANRADGPLYFKTDFHWNYYGASLVARAIIDHLGGAMNTGTRWIQPIVKEPMLNFAGYQNDMLATFSPVLEDSFAVKRFRDQFNYTEPSPPFLFAFSTKLRDRAGLLPKSILFGDSFASYFMPTDFPSYFTHLAHAHHIKFRELHDQIPPDTKVVIWMFAETYTLRMLKDPKRESYWPVLHE